MSAPQLSGDGAELLANVLKKREEDRHDTLSAKRNARRRESDSLRNSPPGDASAEEDGIDDRVVGRSGASGSASIDIDDDDDEIDPEFDESSSQILNFFLAIGFVGAVVTCIFLAVSLSSQPAQTDSADPVVETVGAAPETEVAGAVEEPDEVAAESVDVAEEAAIASAQQDDAAQITDSLDASDSADAEIAREAADVIETVSTRANPEAFNVTVYDADPAVGNVHSFALRIENISAGEEVPTDDLDVFVASGDDQTMALTLSRFVHATVPEGTSALATVRAEQAGPGEQYVYVLLDGVQLARVLIE